MIQNYIFLDLNTIFYLFLKPYNIRFSYKFMLFPFIFLIHYSLQKKKKYHCHFSRFIRLFSLNSENLSVKTYFQLIKI